MQQHSHEQDSETDDFRDISCCPGHLPAASNLLSCCCPASRPAPPCRPWQCLLASSSSTCACNMHQAIVIACQTGDARVVLPVNGSCYCAVSKESRLTLRSLRLPLSSINGFRLGYISDIRGCCQLAAMCCLSPFCCCTACCCCSAYGVAAPFRAPGSSKGL
jgi:hypothetical protein